MKEFCESLRNRDNYLFKKIKLLTSEHHKPYENAKNYYICKEKFEDKHPEDKKYPKDWDHCHYAWVYVPKEIPIIFYNGSSYDDHFVIKELEKDFFACLGENTEKNITFPVPNEK